MLEHVVFLEQKILFKQRKCDLLQLSQFNLILPSEPPFVTEDKLDPCGVVLG